MAKRSDDTAFPTRSRVQKRRGASLPAAVQNAFFGLALIFAAAASPSAGAQDQFQVRRVADLNPGVNGSFPSNLTVFANSLFFSAYTTNTGRELWKYDGAVITLVSNINDTMRDIGFGILIGNDSVPTDFREFDGGLYFSAFDTRRGGELWRTDGTNTVRVADINPDANDTIKTNPASSWPRELTVVANRLYFSADTGGLFPNYELWSSDGTTATQAANIRPDFAANRSSYPQGLTAFNGALCFMADDGVNGYELWKHDGTRATLLADINPGDSSSSSFPKFFTPFNGDLYFQAFHASFGFELWKTDGSSTMMVTNLMPGAGSSNPDSLAVFNGAIYFRATDGTYGYELWKCDGATVTLAADVNPFGDSFAKNLTVFQNKLCFAATDGVHGWELWTYDGTNASLVTDLNTSGDSFPEQFTIFNNALYFVATTPATGYEIWRYDGANVNPATDINPGPGSSFPQNLAAFNQELCFRATGGSTDWELWTLTEGGIGLLGVRPESLLVTAGHIGGPFVPPYHDYTLTNSGGTALDWSASTAVAWLNLTPSSGMLAPFSAVTVRAAIQTDAQLLAVGAHDVQVTFAVSGGTPAMRTLRLDIYPLPAWTGSQRSGMDFVARLQGMPNWRYVVEGSTDLRNWSGVATNQTDANGVLYFTDTPAPSHPQGFYRALAAP